MPLLVSCSLDVSLHLSPFICLPVCLVVSGSLDVSLPLSLKKSVTPMKRKAIIKSNQCLFHWGYGQPRKAPALTVVCFWPRNCVIKSTKSPEKIQVLGALNMERLCIHNIYICMCTPTFLHIHLDYMCIYIYTSYNASIKNIIPVVPHKAVAKVSNIGNLGKGWLL